MSGKGKRVPALRSASGEKPKARAWEIKVSQDQTNAEAVARKIVGPVNRHGALTTLFGGALAGGLSEEDRPGMVEYAHELLRRVEKARDGDLAGASDLLMSQALTLDGIFTETARRAATNMGAGYLQAFETYMRLSLKAQAQSRVTLEALVKLHQPREQTVRHVHVNGGGQAIVADRFHAHTGGAQNGKADIQCHALGAPDAPGSALPGKDPARHSVPVSKDQGTEAMPNAWRQRGRSKR